MLAISIEYAEVYVMDLRFSANLHKRSLKYKKKKGPGKALLPKAPSTNAYEKALINFATLSYGFFSIFSSGIIEGLP